MGTEWIGERIDQTAYVVLVKWALEGEEHIDSICASEEAAIRRVSYDKILAHIDDPVFYEYTWMKETCREKDRYFARIVPCMLREIEPERFRAEREEVGVDAD